MNTLQVNNPPITRFSALSQGDLFCYKDGALDNVYMKLGPSSSWNAVYLRNGVQYQVDQDREVCRVRQVTITNE